jgi:DNA end-binding protein Ku
MAAPTWKGAITFGLVTIPVQLHSAVRASADLHFRQLHEPDLAPVKNARVCSKDGAPVEWGEIVKGYEIEKDRYVVLDDDDFAAAAVHTRTSTVFEIVSFVASQEIDPRYFERPYFVTPGAHGAKAYALLREAMMQGDVVGLGKITMHRKQHLAGLRAVGSALVLTTMRFADELVALEEFTFPSSAEVRAQELAMAEQLVANLREPFDPAPFRDEYREALLEVIERKAKGKRVKVTEPADVKGTPVIDLMARLQESLATGSRRGGRARAARPASAESAKAAKPPAGKRSASGARSAKGRGSGRTRAARPKPRKTA